MTDVHLTGWSSLVVAIALLLHAIRALLPVLAKALGDRAASQRLNAETHAKIEGGREDTARDLRTERDAAKGERDAARSEVKELRSRVAQLEGQLRSLSNEFIEFRAKAVR